MTEPRIQIVRDRDGVAHVRAATLLDALEGQGYAAAQDRLAQIVLDRRRALGRLAEVVGPPAVATDAFHRRLDLVGSAHRSHDALGPEAQAALAAYATGINRYLIDRQRTGRADPPELALLGDDPEPWEPWHSVALFQVRHLLMGTFETKVWRSGLVHHLGAARAARLWPTTPELTVDPDGDIVRVGSSVAEAMALAEPVLALLGRGVGDDAASNNLALAGSNTATGAPIVAGDPHRAIDLPNVYWPNQLTTRDGDIDVIGLSFPGVPGYPHFAHNRDVAWCITHGMADDQDVYVERLRDRDGTVQHLLGGEWQVTDASTEVIEVADGDTVRIEVLRTGRGPVVAGDRADAGGDPWAALSLRWTALVEPDTTFDALVPMLRAASVGDLDTAFVPWVVPVNNVLMADRSGAIAYRMRGRLARRSRDSGWTAVAGDDPGHSWTGFVPDAELPRVADPAGGILVTANNRVAADGPYVSNDWAHPARAMRLTSVLVGRDDWTADDVAALLGDTVSSVALRFAERLRGVRATHPLETRALALLDDWDGRMDVDSAPAALYGTLRAELVRLLCLDLGADDLPGVPTPSLHTRLRLLNARVAFWIDDPELVTDSQLRAALRLATRQLELAQGTDPTRWRWGTAHRARFVHPLHALRPDLADRFATPPAVELGGDNETLWATSTAPPSTEACNGPVARYVFDLAEWDSSRWILPHGVSGDPADDHHADMVQDWAHLRYRPMRFSAGSVDAATESVLDLT